MRTYGEQIEPVLSVVLGKAAGDWGLNGASQLECAVGDAEVSRWLSASSV
jgi:hypothetical protein